MSKYDQISDACLSDLVRYAMRGDEVGGFLTAVLRNDLQRSVMLADDTNIKILSLYVAWLYNVMPVSAWGSSQVMRDWRKARSETPLESKQILWPDQRSEDFARMVDEGKM